jgi:hypothetical protein
VAPNQLNREFTVQAPDKISVGVVTYNPTGEGRLTHVELERAERLRKHIRPTNVGVTRRVLIKASDVAT